VRDFKDLTFWQKAHQLTLSTYRVTADFPRSELFGITSQMRRAAISIEANIAEGCGRWGDGEFGRFLQIAAGSASELECHLLIARDLRFLPPSEHRKLKAALDEICKMLTALRQRVRSAAASG
jgi:four helix bundle protein